jgi:hypothetical protein
MLEETSAVERGARAALVCVASCTNHALTTFQQLFHHQEQAYLEECLCNQEELY